MTGTDDQIVLRTEGLTKRFGRLTAVDSLSLEVRRGDIFGFLGLNGAGKTTTIRLILRLLRPTAGKIWLLGRELHGNYLAAMRKIGALVEVPAFYPYLSGRKNLQVLGLMSGGVSGKRIDEMLGLVGLAGRGHDKVRTYSQGMRQRLGIGQALLAHPEFVILDEPTSNLDPQGIIDVRAIVRAMHDKDGVTFFISSHQLHEVEQLCNRVAVIREGSLVAEGNVSDILHDPAGQLEIVATPAHKALALLKEKAGSDPAFCGAPDQTPDGTIRVHTSPARVAEINSLLVSNGIQVSRLSPKKMSLEEYFIEASLRKR
ncbi:MAG: ABC transporter ATP-binding protein [Planctomycetota bacterium]|nr:ABC transporter ATP-binding protein [Planctomycetota bacterium]